jgi:two-component system nitrate/nitrite response regulator NarL
MKVLVVDDSPLARETIVAALAGHPAFTVVGTAAGGYEGVRLAVELQPDLVLMDLRMPECDGFLATRLIKRQQPGVMVVALSVSGDPQDLFAAVGAGAQGYLPKNLPPSDWLRVLEGLVLGEGSVDRSTAQRILAEFQGAGAAGPGGDLSSLSPREREVLELVGAGHTNREIAATLCISEHTVKNHIKHILEKLHMRNRVELAALAARRIR